MKRKLSYILIFTALVYSGCKVGPDYQRPELSSPSAYRFDSISTDTVLNLEWWTLFNDEVLQELVGIALLENKDLKIAASRIEEARAIAGFTKADIYPQIGIEANALYSNQNPAGGSVDPFSSYYIAPALSWEIDFWGKFRRSNEAARAELMATHYAYRKIMISLISEVAATYFLLLDYDSRLEISRHTLESRIESLRIIQERFDKGIVPEIDLNQSQIQKEIAASSIPSYERAVANTENALSVLLGKNPGAIKRGSFLSDQIMPPEIPAGIPSILLERRPDILETEQYLAAQTARIGVAQAMRFPAISLTGVFGLSSAELSSFLTGESVIWGVGGTLLGPIFNFGKNKRRVEIENERTLQAAYSYENSVLRAFQEVEDALVSIDTYNRELIARENQKTAALNAATLSKDRYNGGVTSYLEVLDSERSLFDSELYASEVLQRKLNAYVQLYKALGGGWISSEEKQAAETEENAE